MKLKLHHRVDFLSLWIFVALFFISIVGAQIGSISLNKICLLPLIAYFLIKKINCGRLLVRLPGNNTLVAWYVLCLLSCMIGFLRFNLAEKYTGYLSNLLNLFAQILLMYLPLTLLALSMDDIDSIYKKFQKMLVVVCRIHLFWGLVQFILYHAIDFDLNEFVFIKVLGGLGRETWTFFMWDYGAPVLRLSGLNYDGAFFGILMLIGLAYDTVLIIKVLYIVSILLSVQRSALVAVVIYMMYLFVKSLRNRKISRGAIIKSIGVVALASIGMIFAYKSIPAVNDTVSKFIDRFDFLSGISNAGQSSTRHILYIPLAFITLFGMDFFAVLFGIGPRNSGVAFALNSDEVGEALQLTQFLKNNAWSVECDIAEILLGTGIIGFALFYYNCFKLYKKGDSYIKSFVVILFALGIMYNFSHLTVVNLMLIFSNAKINGKINRKLIKDIIDEGQKKFKS